MTDKVNVDIPKLVAGEYEDPCLGYWTGYIALDDDGRRALSMAVGKYKFPHAGVGYLVYIALNMDYGGEILTLYRSKIQKRKSSAFKLAYKHMQQLVKLNASWFSPCPTNPSKPR